MLGKETSEYEKIINETKKGSTYDGQNTPTEGYNSSSQNTDTFGEKNVPQKRKNSAVLIIVLISAGIGIGMGMYNGSSKGNHDTKVDSLKTSTTAKSNTQTKESSTLNTNKATSGFASIESMNKPIRQEFAKECMDKTKKYANKMSKLLGTNYEVRTNEDTGSNDKTYSIILENKEGFDSKEPYSEVSASDYYELSTSYVTSDLTVRFTENKSDTLSFDKSFDTILNSFFEDTCKSKLDITAIETKAKELYKQAQSSKETVSYTLQLENHQNIYIGFNKTDEGSIEGSCLATKYYFDSKQ